MTWRNTRCGLFLSVLALAAQLGWNARLPDLPRIELAALLGDAGAICHTDGAAGGQKNPPMTSQDCLMCVYCIGTLATAFLLPNHALFLRAGIVQARFVILPPATGPPPARFAIPRPRGPPVQV